MTRTIFDLTDDEKAAIRAIEIAGLLHNMGKLTDEFVASQSQSPTTFRYFMVAKPDEVFTPEAMSRVRTLGKDTLRKRLASGTEAANPTNVRDYTDELKAASATFWDEPYDLARLVMLGMRVVYEGYSGKYAPVFAPSSIEPARLIGYMHSLAHFEKDDQEAQDLVEAEEEEQAEQEERSRRRVAPGVKQLAGHAYRASPFGHEQKLGRLSEEYQALPIADLQKAIDDSKIFDQLENDLRHALDKGLGHTARPINEVSLWDWGYIVSVLAKAAAAHIFIDGWPEDGDLGNIRFQTVRVSLDRLEAMTHSDRISDLLGIKRTLDDSYNKVKALFEDELAFGKQIYADETGAIFLTPVFDLVVGELRKRVGELFPNDLQPRMAASPAFTAAELGGFRGRNKPEEKGEAFAKAQAEYYTERRRTIANMVARPRREALAEAPIQPEQPPTDWESAWAGDNGRAELCTVCRMRPVGYPRSDNQAEGITLDRWATTKIARERHICRVCLNRRVRQSEAWLESDRSKTIWIDEVADDSGRLALVVGRLPLDEWLDGTLLDTLMIHRATTGPIAKNASPARLYRIAEEGRDFWQTQIDKTIPGAIGGRPFRLKLTPNDPNALKLDRNNAYEVVFDDFVLQAVWAGDHFVSTENLAGLLRRRTTGHEESAGSAESAINMKGRTVSVRSPSGFLQAGEDKASGVTLTDVEEIDHDYMPHINLMAEPGLAMALVPAGKAMAVAAAIRETYNERFARVADRLPLHLGLVYFRRRTPLPAVLDAARRFLDMPAAWERWRVTVENRAATFTDDAGRCFTHTYPAHMGDGQTPDEWYSWLATAEPAPGAAVPVAYIDDVAPETAVYIRPGYFDYEYLDTAGRRYEISYDGPGRRATRLARPFLLADLVGLEATWKAFAEGLDKNQQYQVIGRIEGARESWFGDGDSAAMRQRAADATFTGFVDHALRSASWKKDKRPSDFDALINAATSGQLADLAEIHLEIMAKASD